MRVSGIAEGSTYSPCASHSAASACASAREGRRAGSCPACGRAAVEREREQAVRLLHGGLFPETAWADASSGRGGELDRVDRLSGAGRQVFQQVGIVRLLAHGAYLTPRAPHCETGDGWRRPTEGPECCLSATLTRKRSLNHKRRRRLSCSSPRRSPTMRVIEGRCMFRLGVFVAPSRRVRPPARRARSKSSRAAARSWVRRQGGRVHRRAAWHGAGVRLQQRHGATISRLDCAIPTR